MPELDILVVLFPAEKNLTTANDRGKINQATLQFLDENLTALKFQKSVRISERSRIERLTRSPPWSCPDADQTIHAPIVGFQLRSQLQQLVQPLPYLRQQSPGFFTRVMFLKLVSHENKGGSRPAY